MEKGNVDTLLSTIWDLAEEMQFSGDRASAFAPRIKMNIAMLRKELQNERHRGLNRSPA